MTFAADIRHWPTVAAFAQSLADRAAPHWASGVVVHHTYRPLVSQWRGMASMHGLRTFYASKGWTAGPHLFLVAGAGPDRDGIWQLTPLTQPGVHAGPCNTTHWGVEVVGDYDTQPWPPAVAELTIGVLAALLRWRGLDVSPNTLRGHRDCMDTRCPGRAIDLNAVRSAVARALPAPDALPITADAAIIAAPRCTLAQAAAYLARQRSPHYTSADIRLVILPAYWSWCEQAGVDPCIAIAQMCHETDHLRSFWSARPQRNPAGIGVTGQSSVTRPSNADGWAYNPDRRRWERGISFPTWANHSVPAHVGRLVAYATTPAQRTPAQQALVDEALRYRSLPATYHGAAPTLRQLNRRWAASDGYGERIADIAELIRREAA